MFELVEFLPGDVNLNVELDFLLDLAEMYLCKVLLVMRLRCSAPFDSPHRRH